MNNKKMTWIKPVVLSVDSEITKNTIVVSACSSYEICWPAGAHIVSIPGKPPVSM